MEIFNVNMKAMFVILETSLVLMILIEKYLTIYFMRQNKKASKILNSYLNDV